MGLIPTHRGQGIGRMLIETTLIQSWKLGSTRVELDVHSDNESAIALYEKVGFAREGIQRHASLIDGVTETPSLWRSSLASLAGQIKLRHYPTSGPATASWLIR